jgi:hypothetical protein
VRLRGAAVGAAAVVSMVLLSGCSQTNETGAVPISADQADTGSGEPAPADAPVATSAPPRSAPTLSPTPRSLLQRQADKQIKAAEDKLKKKANFIMPALVGRNLQAAQDQLQAKGSYLLNQVDATGQNRKSVVDRDWRVCSQKPAAGAKVTVLQLVTLRSVKLSESCPK